MYLFILFPCSKLVAIYTRGYLLDTLLRLYVRSGLHVGRGGKKVFSRVTTGTGKVLISGYFAIYYKFEAVKHYSNICFIFDNPHFQCSTIGSISLYRSRLFFSALSFIR